MTIAKGKMSVIVKTVEDGSIAQVWIWNGNLVERVEGVLALEASSPGTLSATIAQCMNMELTGNSCLIAIKCGS